ncbi:cell wall-binding repeat-containing protein [Desulfosporosinus sp. Sb-LF]|uniref:N-acetylmuramoyl-L-alanine amidase n=1 Tax=Desulfosporosinus sp. Sb-LF TaxID=2560027 RepID=UPI00107FBB2B|nr:cell wall-binding repeat-containing protein [Desulfosporosinus sp. Sb-LF]TGE33809.1 N-acetylmuramoyl-L-alanine amidase [Desulfosporosinus sp. Sb-LF]
MANLKWGLIGILVLVFWLGLQNPANASPLALETSRISGERQIDTAIEVSKTGWQHANTVLLANCDHFPDALVAAPLSHQLDAPILLTPAGGVDAKVMEEIKRLGAQQVILLGGEVALSPKVEADIQNAGLGKPERIAGYDQYETAQKVAERVGTKGQVILANGEQFPDALAISAYAGVTETPILLTNAKKMPASTQQELNSLQQKGDLDTIVVGGEAVVSSTILSGLNSVQRIAGNDRYETAAAVYEFAMDALPAQTTYLVTGENFPDALAAGGLAAKQQAQIVMAQTSTLPGSTYSVLSRPTESPMNVVIVGGLAVITDQVKAMIQGDVQPSYLLAGVTVVVDPGHGGPDTGAIGAKGTYEKNNTLAVGLDLAGLLRSAGARVVLTRSTDISPVTGTYSELSDLQARTKIANDLKADLYISLHNDSFSNPEASGTTTYYSSASPVTTQSKNLADSIQSELVKVISLPSRGTKDAAFYVIKNTKMPAVLVEIGFISNPTEETLLGSPDFQQKAALGIYRGVLKYKGY